MDRKKFLKLCESVSRLPTGAYGIAQNVPDALTVLYKGIKYYPSGFKLWFKNGECFDCAILHDLKTNTVLHCELSKVKGVPEE